MRTGGGYGEKAYGDGQYLVFDQAVLCVGQKHAAICGGQGSDPHPDPAAGLLSDEVYDVSGSGTDEGRQRCSGISCLTAGPCCC